MPTTRNWTFPFFIWLCAIPLIGQSSYSEVLAKKMYKKGLHRQSCEMFKSVLNERYDLEKTLLKASDACFKCGDYNASKRFLNQITSSQKKYSDAHIFQRARQLHLEGDFEESAEEFKNFLRNSSRRDKMREEAKQYLQWNWNALRARRKGKTALVQNAGRTINTSFDDRYPVPSPTVTGRYYFSRADSATTGGRRNAKGRQKGKYQFYRYDIVAADLINGKWSDISPIDPLFNSTSHDHIVDFSADGQIMYFYKGLDLEGDKILTDTFVLDRSIEMKRGQFPPMFGKDLDLFQERVVVFALKDQKDGYGGWDLYISAKTPQGWTGPKNLGPEINGVGDERRPFLANNGKVLYYSSNGPRSTGGYDIFKSVFSLLDESWSKSENLGRGVNSARDELDFRLSADGRLGVMSSNRAGGKGGFDLYVAYLNDQALEQLESAYSFDISEWVTRAPKVIANQREVTPSEVNQVPREEEIGQIVYPIVFEDEDFLRKSSTKNAIESVVRVMSQRPKSKVVVYGHLSDFTDESRNVFFSAQYAMQVKDKLLEAGISEGRVIVKGYGSKRPVTKAIPRGVQTKNWNNRITFRVIQSIQDEPLKLVYEEVELPSTLTREAKYDMYTGLNYRILIEQSEQILDNPEILQLDNLIIEQRGRGLFQYMLEDVDKYEEAKKWKAELLDRRLTVPMIIPYIGEEPIPQGELIRTSLRYPDLKEYNRDQ